MKNSTNHPMITLMLIWLSIDYTRPGCKIELEYTIHQLNLNPTDFVPLGAALTQFLCISICVYQWVLDCSSGLKGKAGVGAREGGGGLNTIIGSIVQAGSAAPGPESSSQLTPCQFWLDSVLCSLVTALALARHSRSPGKVFNNKMLNWIPPSPARAPPSQALILARVIEL